MNVGIKQLINDAKDLVGRLKERENNLDQVVVQSNALVKRVDAIQQLENELISFNEKAHHKSKAAVLSNIQKEDRIIKLLQQENEELKESLEEHQSVLEIIMKKYRQQLVQLISLKKKQVETEDLFKNNLIEKLQEKTDLAAEMASVMRKAIEIDDRNSNEFNEKLNELIIENNGLRELLSINMKYGSKEVIDDRTTAKLDKEVQTQFDDDIAPTQYVDCNSQTTNEQSVEQTTTETQTATETETAITADQQDENNS